MENVRIKIAILWIFFTVVMAAASLLYIFEPGSLQKVTDEGLTLSLEMETVELLRIYLIPLTMAFLSVTLGDVWSRRLNLVVGAVWILFAIYYVMICPMIHIFDTPHIPQLLIGLSAIVATALISWYAYRWPKHDA